MEFEFLAKLKQNLTKHKENIDDVLAKYSCVDESQEVDFDEDLSDETDESYEIGVEESDEAEEAGEDEDEEFTQKQVSFVRGICESFYHSTPTSTVQKQLAFNQTTSSLVEISPKTIKTTVLRAVPSTKGTILNRVREKNFIQTKIHLADNNNVKGYTTNQSNNAEDSALVCRRLSGMDSSFDRSGAKFDLMALCKERSSPGKKSTHKGSSFAEETGMQTNTQVSQVVVNEVGKARADFIEETVVLQSSTQSLVREPQAGIVEETVMQANTQVSPMMVNEVEQVQASTQSLVRENQAGIVEDTIMQANTQISQVVVNEVGKARVDYIEETVVLQSSTQSLVREHQAGIVEETIIQDYYGVKSTEVVDDDSTTESQVIACTVDVGSNDCELSWLSAGDIEDAEEINKSDVAVDEKKSPVLRDFSVVLNDVSNLTCLRKTNMTIEKDRDMIATDQNNQKEVTKNPKFEEKGIIPDMNLEDLVKAEHSKIAALEKEINELRRLRAAKKCEPKPISPTSMNYDEIFSADNESAELMDKSTAKTTTKNTNKISFVELLKNDFLILNASLTEQDEVNKKKKRMNTADFIQSTCVLVKKHTSKSNASTVKKSKSSDTSKKKKHRHLKRSEKTKLKTREIGTSPYHETAVSFCRSEIETEKASLQRVMTKEMSTSPYKERKKKSVEFVLPVVDITSVNSDFDDEAENHQPPIEAKNVSKVASKKLIASRILSVEASPALNFHRPSDQAQDTSLLKKTRPLKEKKKKSVEFNIPAVELTSNNSDYDDEAENHQPLIEMKSVSNKKSNANRIRSVVTSSALNSNRQSEHAQETSLLKKTRPLKERKKSSFEFNIPAVELTSNNSDYDDETDTLKPSIEMKSVSNKKSNANRITSVEASSPTLPVPKRHQPSDQMFKTPLQVPDKLVNTSNKRVVSSANTPIVIKLRRKDTNNSNNSTMENSINFYNATFLSLSSLQTSRNTSPSTSSVSNSSKNSPLARPTTKSQHFNFKNILLNKSLNVNR